MMPNSPNRLLHKLPLNWIANNQYPSSLWAIEGRYRLIGVRRGIEGDVEVSRCLGHIPICYDAHLTISSLMPHILPFDGK